VSQKINLLFDASNIVEGFSSNNFSRSGIYWVAYNLLWQFISSANYKVTLLITPCSVFIKNRIRKHFHYSNRYITFYDNNRYLNNIEISKSRIKTNKNIIKISYHILKIWRNRIYINLSKKLTNKIKNVNIYFSCLYSIPEEIRSNPVIISYQILYDCIPSINKELYPFIDSNHWYMKLVNNLDKNVNYFCISNCTKNDFLKNFSDNLDREKLNVTPIASSMNYSPQYGIDEMINVLKKYNVALKSDSLYILSLCTIEPRKNLVFTVNCFINFLKKNKITNLFFIIGGGYFPNYIEYFKSMIDALPEYRDRIILLGYVNDEDINILYSNALLFISLTQYEGFGMTVLEAMQAGAPVICSDNSSLPEVVADAAITIPCDDEVSCIEAMEKIYFNEEVRKDYISRGIERAKTFTWEKTFEQINNVIMRNSYPL